MDETEALMQFDDKGYRYSAARLGGRFVVDLEDGSYMFDSENGVRRFPLDAEGKVVDVWNICDRKSKKVYDIINRIRKYWEESGMFTSKNELLFDVVISVKSNRGTYVPMVMSIDYQYDDEKRAFSNIYGSIHDYDDVIPPTAEECVVGYLDRELALKASVC